MKRPPVVRIIGGKWRGYKLAFAPSTQLRPTGDRMRETLFNWLSPHIRNSRCLDMFAGSGALGFEALSRGARQVVMLDNSASNIAQLALNKAKLAEEAADAIDTHCVDALRYLQGQMPPFDIVFIDPPFANNLLTRACTLLETSGLLTDQAHLYIESMWEQPWQPPDNWSQKKYSRMGQAVAQLYRRNPDL